MIKFMYSDGYELNAKNEWGGIVLTADIKTVSDLYVYSLKFGEQVAKFKENLVIEIYSLFLQSPISIIRYNYKEIVEGGGLDIYKFACSIIASLYEDFELR